MRLTPITSLRDSKDPHADAIDLAHITASTIDSSEIGILRWGSVPIANMISYTTEKYEKEIRNGVTTPAISTEATDDLGSYVDRFEHLVIRDLDLPQVEPTSGTGTSPGRIVAHAEYIYCPADWWSRNKYTPADADPILEGDNQALFDHFTTEIYRISEIHTKGEEFYMVTACSTLDTHLRNGIASRLVQWIFPFVNANKRPLFLMASPSGAHVYRKNGYENTGGDNGVVEFQLEDWGGTKGAVHQLIAMRRKPS